MNKETVKWQHYGELFQTVWDYIDNLVRGRETT